MNQSFRKFVSTGVSLAMALAISGAASVTYAAVQPLTNASATLSNVAGAGASLVSNHTIQFNVAQTTSIQAIGLVYAIEPTVNNTAPSGLVTTTGQLSGGANDQVAVAGGATTGWAYNSSTNGAAVIYKAGGSGVRIAGDTISLTVNNLTNNSSTAVGAGTQCDSIVDSETCYIRITTYATITGTTPSVPIDTATISYTVVTPTTVTATVDPSLTFTVAGVTSVANINTNDANALCSGNDIVSTSKTIPFGSLRVGVPQCGQQSLTVATNAQHGFVVYQKFVGASPTANLMQGTNTANNFDPFDEHSATFSTPAVFDLVPSGSANVDSGLVGIRIVNPAGMSPGVSGFGSSNLYAPPAVSTTTIGNAIMNNSGPDNGAAPSFITYKIENGASQPADTYTGTVVYNVVATF